MGGKKEDCTKGGAGAGRAVLVEASDAVAAEDAMLREGADNGGWVALVRLGAFAVGLGVDAAPFKEWAAVGGVGATFVEVNVVDLAFPATAEMRVAFPPNRVGVGVVAVEGAEVEADAVEGGAGLDGLVEDGGGLGEVAVAAVGGEAKEGVALGVE
eukprot:scaffold29976_cov151-Isochrysis_galbana.AAC.3